MWQMTVRHLDPAVVQGLKVRAAAAGRSLEDEVRTILSDSILKQRAGAPSAWAKQMHSKRREFSGDSVFAGADAMFGAIQLGHAPLADEWASATPRFYEK